MLSNTTAGSITVGKSVTTAGCSTPLLSYSLRVTKHCLDVPELCHRPLGQQRQWDCLRRAGMLCGGLLQGQPPGPGLPVEPSHLVGSQRQDGKVVVEMTQGLTASKGPFSSRPFCLLQGLGN